MQVMMHASGTDCALVPRITTEARRLYLKIIIGIEVVVFVKGSWETYCALSGTWTNWES